jgi:site-specific recombinase XerD
MAQRNAGRRKTLASKYMTEAEIEQFFGVITDVRDRAMFRVIYHRGLRATELGLLTLADYHITRERLDVTRLKGSHDEEYALTSIEAVCVGEWLKVRGLAPGPLFLSRKQHLKPIEQLKAGRKTMPGAIQRAQLFRLMRKYCALAGIPTTKAHPHALRHSCGTHVLKLVEGNMSIVQHILGHADIRSTQIYAHFTEQEAAAEKLRDWGSKKAA